MGCRTLRGTREEPSTQIRSFSLAFEPFSPCLPVPRNLHALALSRAARCLERLRREREAHEAWRELALAYRDERDLLSQPYGLIAAIELVGRVTSPSIVRSRRRQMLAFLRIVRYQALIVPSNVLWSEGRCLREMSPFWTACAFKSVRRKR